MTAISRAQATVLAEQIRAETSIGANTPDRVGTCLKNMIDSTVFQGEAITPPTAGNGLTGTNVFSVLANGTTLDVSASGVRISDLAANSVLGRAGGTSGAVAGISGTDGQAMRVSGSTLGFGTLATAAHADASITMAKLADLAGLSVNGRASNTSGVPAAITASTTGTVLLYNGTTIGFGAPAFGAQNVTTTGYVGVGSALPASGSIRLAQGSTIKGLTTGAGTISILDWGANTPDNLLIGDSTVSLSIDGASALTLKSGSSTRMTVGTNISMYVTRLRFKTGIGDSTLEIEGNSTNGATAQLLSIIGQNLAGTGTTGGSVAILPGPGVTAGGELYLSSSTAVKRVRVNDMGLSLFNAAIAAQSADIGALSTSVGTFSSTIPDVGAAFNQTTLNNIVKSLATQINSLRTTLRTLGSMA